MYPVGWSHYKSSLTGGRDALPQRALARTVQKSANRFVLGTKRTDTRSPERRQYGLSIDTQRIDGVSTGDDRSHG